VKLITASRNQGRNEGGQRVHNSLGAKALWGSQITVGGVECLREWSKIPNNVRSTSFNTAHLLPKDLRFDHGGAKLASCPGCHL